MATSSKTRRKAPPAADTAVTDAALATETPTAPAAPARQAKAKPAAAKKAAAAKPGAKTAAKAPARPAARPAAVPETAAESVAEDSATPAPASVAVAAETAPAADASPARRAKAAPAKSAQPSKSRKAAQPTTKPAPARQKKTAAPAGREAASAVAAPSPAPASVQAPAPEPTPAPEPASSTESEGLAPPAPVASRPGARGPAAAKRAAKPSRRGPRPAADPQAAATAQAVLAVLAAPDAHATQPASEPPAAEPRAAEAAPRPPRPPRPGRDAGRARTATPTAASAAPMAAPMAAPTPAPTGPAHSAIVCQPGDQARVVWQPGHACPAALLQAAQRRLNADGGLAPEDDTALPTLLRLAHEAGHELRVDEAVWAHLAAHRDARRRLSALEAAYPDGPASAALQHLLQVPLPLFQAEGALFAVVAGRALIADERGLGKGVQAIAAAQLWRQHFGVQRMLVLCAPAQRAAWQRSWRRFAGDAARRPLGDVQVIDGGLHQRQAMWSTAAGVRILSPEGLDSDAAHLAHWAPDLIIVDEPQQLGLHEHDWARLQSPHALVLCGAPLAEQPALMDSLLRWLDTARLGPLAALRELHVASEGGLALGEDDIERLTIALSRLMLQRLRADVADQLPALVHTERLVPLAPGQRELHDQHAAVARRVLAGWQASGWCSDADQWRLAQALRGMQQACHRADPADADSGLAESTVQALAAQLADWAGTGAPRVAVLCTSAADRDQLAQRLAPADGETGTAAAAPLLLAPGEPLPGQRDAVLQVGVPWRPRRHPAGPRGEADPGQQWVYLVAQGSLEAGLFDTLAQRGDVPRGLGDGGARDYLGGAALTDWLAAVQAAVLAMDADTSPAV